MREKLLAGVQEAGYCMCVQAVAEGDNVQFVQLRHLLQKGLRTRPQFSVIEGGAAARARQLEVMHVLQEITRNRACIEMSRVCGPVGNKVEHGLGSESSNQDKLKSFLEICKP